MTAEFSMEQAGVMVGLEIHQQLDTGRKLFCGCSGTAPPGRIERFSRRLRPVKSEMGRYDPAALFEGSKSKTMMYHADVNNSCLVERDEEPPHEVDPASKRAALVVASSLRSNIFDEIYAMRKTVIDGSNTSGFQRTMLVSQGGVLETADMNVGVQSICLEEDAAKVLGEKGDIKEYGLERLGIPLVEIALDPIRGTPGEVRRVAEHLGRLLRSTGMVARGIGSIRQDVNVSVDGGGGIVEMKGVQQLDQLEKAIGYEARRQAGLIKIAGMIKSRGMPELTDGDVFDVSGALAGCQSRIIRGEQKKKSAIMGIRIRGFAGILGYTPYDGIRLGREIGQMVKFYGIGGVFHSDELPNYGINEDDLGALRGLMGITDKDAFVIVAGPPAKISFATQSIINRIREAGAGVPAETRLATPTGETVFLRPRPGSSRMYPETDIPPVLVSARDREEAAQNVPKPWDELLAETASRYNINVQLAGQLLDSDYTGIFEEITGRTAVPPAFAASALCSTITSLSREGLDPERLSDEAIRGTFDLLDGNRISKEAVEMIFRDIMAGRSSTTEEAVKNTGAGSASDADISDMLDDLIRENRSMVLRQKGRALGPLMGAAMSRLRGKAAGELVNRMLEQKIRDYTDGGG